MPFGKLGKYLHFNKISGDNLNSFGFLRFFWYLILVDDCGHQLWLGMPYRNIHCVCDNGFDLRPNGTLERCGCDFDRLSQS